MSNLDAWKTAKEAFEDAEGEYLAARNATIDAGNKRGHAWEALVQAASTLSDDERRQAAEYEFGPALPSTDGCPK